MVSSVNFGSGYNPKQYSKDLENIIKYSTGTTVVAQQESPFAGMGVMLGIGGAIEAFKGGKWLWNNRKDLKGAWANYAQESKVQSEAFNNAGGYKNVNAYKVALNEQKAKAINEVIPSGDKFEKLGEKAQAHYNKAKEMAKFATENPQHAEKAFKIANGRLAQANNLAHKESVNAPAIKYQGNKYTDIKFLDKGLDNTRTFLAKLTKGFKKFTDLSAAKGELLELATKSPTTAKLLKYSKGQGLFIAITGVVELLTQVLPAFGLGADKGVIQTVKSTVNTGASVGGWVAGSALGTKAGAMLGAAIGSVGGPVGTLAGGVVGSVIGLAGGCIGSWAAMKASKAFIGENEVEKAKEKQAKEMAKEISKDPKAVKELIITTAQKLDAEGIKTEDAKAAYISMQKVALATDEQESSNNPFNKKA